MAFSGARTCLSGEEAKGLGLVGLAGGLQRLSACSRPRLSLQPSQMCRGHPRTPHWAGLCTAPSFRCPPTDSAPVLGRWGGSHFQWHSLALGLTSQKRGASPPSASVGPRARPVADAAVLPGRLSIGVLPPGTPVAWGAVVPMSEPRRLRHREVKSTFGVAEGGEADVCRPTADGASWGSSSCLAWVGWFSPWSEDQGSRSPAPECCRMRGDEEA